MELESHKATTSATVTVADGGDHRTMVMELPLGAAAATFNLEKAVCSHGLFMMAPNYWDPLSKTLQRPLRLSLDFDDHDHETSLLVRISHPSDSPDALQLRVFGTDTLTAKHQQALLAQVRRMLRLSEAENRIVTEFQEVYAEARERGFGRVFRSPTLFEDMIKCILLCNCQWSRTLSMARALCELQSELQCSSSSLSFAEGGDGMNLGNQVAKTEHFIPRTPVGKESKIKRVPRKRSKNLASRFTEVKAAVESDHNLETGSAEISELFQESANGSPIVSGSDSKEGLLQKCDPCQTSIRVHKIDLLFSGGAESHNSRIGNFPSPRDLVKVDKHFLAKRCSLGYRASRILNLARSVAEGRIQLRELEEACSNPCLSDYEKLAEQLKEIDGFGPFTCANVLMCMGFYHVIPTDSETIRHLKQVHARDSTTRTVQKEVEVIYGKYAPFQFLAYWSEVWHFYEEWFGKLSEMPPAEYKLITAANMTPNRNSECKRAKTSL